MTDVLGGLNVRDFGARGDGATDDTAAFRSGFAALPPGGGTVYVPPGTYQVARLALPAHPKTVRLHGAGLNATVLAAAVPETPIFAGPPAQAPYAVRFSRVQDLSLQAHAAGSHGTAVELRGHNATVWEEIGYRCAPDTRATFGSLFLLDATIVCYANILRRVVIMEQSGPAKVVDSANAKDYWTNSNLNWFYNFYIYSNIGIVRILDLRNTTGSHVRDCEFESNPGAVGVVPGNGTTVSGCWFEALGTPILADTTASLLPHTGTFQGNYFSGGTIDIPPGVAEWSFEGNAGPVTIHDEGIRTLIRKGSGS